MNIKLYQDPKIFNEKYFDLFHPDGLKCIGYFALNYKKGEGWDGFWKNSRHRDFTEEKPIAKTKDELILCSAICNRLTSFLPCGMDIQAMERLRRTNIPAANGHLYFFLDVNNIKRYDAVIEFITENGEKTSPIKIYLYRRHENVY